MIGPAHGHDGAAYRLRPPVSFAGRRAGPSALRRGTISVETMGAPPQTTRGREPHESLTIRGPSGDWPSPRHDLRWLPSADDRAGADASEAVKRFADDLVCGSGLGNVSADGEHGPVLRGLNRAGVGDDPPVPLPGMAAVRWACAVTGVQSELAEAVPSLGVAGQVAGSPNRARACRWLAAAAG
jgi:hypothetical protein